jgi:hypothetical protein
MQGGGDVQTDDGGLGRFHIHRYFILPKKNADRIGEPMPGLRVSGVSSLSEAIAVL